jgi:CxxC-x17-CxxC domain-containing protein
MSLTGRISSFLSVRRLLTHRNYLIQATTQGEYIMAQTEAAHELDISLESKYQDRSIKCVDCNEDFVWTAGEQVFFHDKGLKNEPKRCKPCKQAKNERLAAIAAAQTSGVRQRIEVTVLCAQCGQQTTVPFYPSQGRPVYCRSCFLAGKVSGSDAPQA